MKKITLKLNWPVYIIFYKFTNGMNDQKICYDFLEKKGKHYNSYNDRLKYYNNPEGKDEKYERSDYLNWCKEPIWSRAKEIAHSEIGVTSKHMREQYNGKPFIIGEYFYQNGEDFAVSISNGKINWQILAPNILDTLKLFYPTAHSIMERLNIDGKNKFDFIPKEYRQQLIGQEPLKIPEIEIDKIDNVFGTNWEIVRANEYSMNNDKVKFILHPIRLLFQTFNNEKLALNVCIKISR